MIDWLVQISIDTFNLLKGQFCLIFFIFIFWETFNCLSFILVISNGKGRTTQSMYYDKSNIWERKIKLSVSYKRKTKDSGFKIDRYTLNR